jgi:FAD/FMN-containing dehydrogenase
VATVSTIGFPTTFAGEVVRRADAGYDAARRVWNAMIDRRPEVIARCTCAADVASSLRVAAELGLPVAVRGGGHNVAGHGVCDDGLVVDLSPMRAVTVDPRTRRARAQGGSLLADLDAATQAHGLVTTGGLVSTTGIGGFTLGGGLGWLARRFGPACDNLVSAEVVLANGEVVIASESENPGLFWGLRGGGGNFGVVTSFEYRLHPLAGAVLAGVVVFPYDVAVDTLRFVREYTAEAPDEVTVIVAVVKPGPAPFMPSERATEPVLALSVCCADDDLVRGERALAALRGYGRPLVDTVAPTPYVALQRNSDAAFPSGRLHYWKSSYFSGLSEAAIDTFVAWAGSMPSPLSWAYLQHLGGAIGRVDRTASAFVHRDEAYDFNILAQWADPVSTDENVAWARSFWTAMQAHAAGGVYVNNLGGEGDDRVRAAYDPAAFGRLAALKRRYDPANVFHHNQNIPPA